MTSLAETMVRLVDRYGILPERQRVLVAVSGGVDSMVLLQLLQALAPMREWKLVVAHLNHRLRGRSSDADARFVQTQCEKLGVPCVVGSRDVKLLSKRRKISIEMAAREARHRFLSQTARKRKCPVIAVAHHADDQAELVLLRLLRGSGSEGLGAMSVCDPSPVNSDLRLVRPLLEIPREEIVAFASRNDIAFREDRTNASKRHLRNRVRHELLPLLRAHYQPAISPVLCRTAAILSAEADCIRELAEQWRANRRQPFERLPLAVRRRMVHLQALEQGIQLEFEAVEQLVAQAEKKVNVAHGRQLLRQPDGSVELVVAPKLVASKAVLVVALGKSGQVRFGGRTLQWRVQSQPQWQQPRQKAGREVFDADRVGRRITLRHWRAGDRFQPIGLAGSVKLQDLFMNLKVARLDRSRRVVAVAENGEIFWVEGLRIGERFKLRPDTRKQLIWRLNC